MTLSVISKYWSVDTEMGGNSLQVEQVAFIHMMRLVLYIGFRRKIAEVGMSEDLAFIFFSLRY